METTAESFFRYEYTETRELLKVFITLLSATLVFSLTFAEKVVNFQKARIGARRCLISAWILFVAAIVLCGTSMVLIAAATGTIIYGAVPFIRTPYWELATASWSCILGAGGSFVVGLVLMVSAAVMSATDTARINAAEKRLIAAGENDEKN